MTGANKNVYVVHANWMNGRMEEIKLGTAENWIII
jgi:hypothetical protein